MLSKANLERASLYARWRYAREVVEGYLPDASPAKIRSMAKRSLAVLGFPPVPMWHDNGHHLRPLAEGYRGRTDWTLYDRAELAEYCNAIDSHYRIACEASSHEDAAAKAAFDACPWADEYTVARVTRTRVLLKRYRPLTVEEKGVW